MKPIIYELPLSEHLRVLIRLEHSLQQFNHHIDNLNSTSLYLALKTADEILDILNSNNVNAHLEDEVTHLGQELLIWRNNPNVDESILDNIYHDLNDIASNILKSPDIGIIAENNFLKIFRKQCRLAAGMSAIDFPRFNFWIQQDLIAIKANLLEWAQIFKVYFSAVNLVLKLIRGTSFTSEHTAQMGYFQENLDRDIEYKLIRVMIPVGIPCFAEITGGKYHVTVRMLQDDWNYGTTTYKHNVDFVLSKCRK